MCNSVTSLQIGFPVKTGVVLALPPTTQPLFFGSTSLVSCRRHFKICMCLQIYGLYIKYSMMTVNWHCLCGRLSPNQCKNKSTNSQGYMFAAVNPASNPTYIWKTRNGPVSLESLMQKRKKYETWKFRAEKHHFCCSRRQMLADIEQWSEQESMFPHIPKNQSNANWLLHLQLGCFSGLVQLLGLERVLLIIRRASSLCWLADEETIAAPHFTFRGCPSEEPDKPPQLGSDSKADYHFHPSTEKKKNQKKWKKKKIFKAMQLWGKVLEPGTETAFGIKAPCLFGIHCQGPSEEM